MPEPKPHDPKLRGYRDLIDHAATRVADGSDVIAQSMGGVVAVGLALTQPRKVRRLVLVATSGGLDVERHDAENWRDEHHQAFPAAAAWVTSDQVDYTDHMHRVTVPTCLIWGDADPVSPLAIGHARHRALPSSVLHVIAGGTHMLAREAPDEIAAGGIPGQTARCTQSGTLESCPRPCPSGSSARGSASC